MDFQYTTINYPSVSLGRIFTLVIYVWIFPTSLYCTTYCGVNVKRGEDRKFRLYECNILLSRVGNPLEMVNYKRPPTHNETSQVFSWKKSYTASAFETAKPRTLSEHLNPVMLTSHMIVQRKIVYNLTLLSQWHIFVRVFNFDSSFPNTDVYTT